MRGPVDDTDAMAAVVLAGGRARRFDGVDKLALPVAGRTLLDRTLDAATAADPIVVVGPRRRTSTRVRWVREDPPGAGPLAAIEAGLREVPAGSSLVAVVAGDHAYLTARTLARTRSALRRDPDAAGAVLLDPMGQPQWLLGVWRACALRAAMPGEVADRSVRSVLESLAPLRLQGSVREVSDVDTPEDMRRVCD